MQRKKAQALTVALTIPILLLADQVIKISVKTSMFLHESQRVTDWFYILFTENRGMAFGMELFDKLFLTSFRIIAVVALSWYIIRRIRLGVQWGFLVCLTLILAGAAGNIIDCLFYGMIFDAPQPPAVAQFVPWGTGYAPMMMGRVVDMFYFPLVEWDWPSWLPFWGGEHFIFFSPIFNFADACISCGCIAMILFCYKQIRE